tara:strand:- start:115 stop:459 length:345 start_codon:yes stop_codon:yes gene_type:complete
MDAFDDIEPLLNETNFDELMDKVSSLTPEVKALPNPHVQEPTFVSAPPNLLQRTSILLNELTRLLPKESGIKEAVNEISIDIGYALHYQYEAGFANGFRLGSGSQNDSAKPRVA